MATVIKCIVADKKAVEILRLIKASCLEPPVVEPLDGTETAPKGSLTQTIYKIVENAKGPIPVAQFREAARAINGNPNAYSYALKTLLDSKKLKRGKLPKTFEVVK